MPAPINGFKQAILAGRQQVGLWLSLANAYTAEIAALAGFDWLLIDGEHAPNDIRSILAQLQALSGTPSHAVVRLPAAETWIVKQVLDIGAQTILVPMVESAEQARSIVAATRYAPAGVRGIGAALARASRFNGIADYIATAGEQICVLVQIESRAGVAALDDILEVEGVDGIFIGPSDLAADLGYPGRAGDPAVQRVVRDALARIKTAGRPSGILSSDAALLEGYISSGVAFVAVGSDVGLFTTGLAALRKRWPGQSSAVACYV